MTLANTPLFCQGRAIARLSGCAAVWAIAIAAPLPLSAQSVEMKSEPEAGDMVLLREVPTRSAQKEGHGDALTANASPNDAFDDAIGLGVNQIDDADAAQITSSALNDLYHLTMVDGALSDTETLIAGAVSDSRLTLFGDPSATNVTSFVNGPVDTAIATANSATSNAIGSINKALSGINLSGPAR